MTYHNHTLLENPDLHSHSRLSDGDLSPAAVVQRAAAHGVTMLALTDHDETAGLDEAVNEAHRCGLQLVPGVEVSASYCGVSVHIVGLHIDYHHSQLLEGLAGIRSRRETRARRISEALEKQGITDAFAGARRFACNPQLLGRLHFARFLVAEGYVADVQAAFDRYLGQGRPACITTGWAAGLSEAVGWIREAGGVAVLAHPGRYVLTAMQMDQLFEQFMACGGEAVEVVSSAHDVVMTEHYTRVARRRGLLASRGSDFHGVNEQRFDIGRCAPLPGGLQPVWSRWCSD